jgi:hypothetical protein
MHNHNPKLLESIKLQLFSATEDGMHVELVESKDDLQPLITFREDENLGMQVLLHLQDRDLAFPLIELERAIEFARQEVHKESFYDHTAPCHELPL